MKVKIGFSPNCSDYTKKFYMTSKDEALDTLVAIYKSGYMINIKVSELCFTLEPKSIKKTIEKFGPKIVFNKCNYDDKTYDYVFSEYNFDYNKRVTVQKDYMKRIGKITSLVNTIKNVEFIEFMLHMRGIWDDGYCVWGNASDLNLELNEGKWSVLTGFHTDASSKIRSDRNVKNSDDSCTDTEIQNNMMDELNLISNEEDYV